MLRLRLKEVQGEEETINERLKEWKMEDWRMEDAEIDEWEKVLLSDSDIDL